MASNADTYLALAKAYGAWNDLIETLEDLQHGRYAKDEMLATMVAQMTPLGPWLRFQMSKGEWTESEASE